MPHDQAHGHLRAYLILLGVLIILTGLLYQIGFGRFVQQQPPVAPQRADIPLGFPQDAPTPTPQDTVAAQHGFQYLVTWDGNAFAPASLSVRKGQTVRFTNTASSPLPLTLSAQQGQQLLDHGQYLEYTFSKTGSFTFSDGTHTGAVTVK
jgi:plastocyanin